MLAQSPTIPTEIEMDDHLRTLMCGINHQVFTKLGDKVVAGPFAGMKIPQHAPWDDGNSGTKLFGYYEFELHDVINRVVAKQPDTIINVGCAEGYYAIGLAMAVPNAKVYALDIDGRSTDLCNEYARLNGVDDRVLTSTTQITFPSSGSVFCIIDCEGGEIEALDKDRHPVLVNSDILVECHDFLNASTSNMLAARFVDTHDIELIKPRLPTFEQFDFLRYSPTAMAVLAVTEKRPMPTCWLAMWARRQ